MEKKLTDEERKLIKNSSALREKIAIELNIKEYTVLEYSKRRNRETALTQSPVFWRTIEAHLKESKLKTK